ncbi:MAG: bifunctional phosphoribosyl-AMP cyclohydrolase/phosphoribosyl-ATP diphosphatase, partial [Cytophagaceae bacterium]
MLGFMNSESFEKTLTSGYLTFYSRTRQRLWMKGEESGHRLKMMSWTGDCDDDTVLFQVKAMGPTCHLKKESCFGDWEKDPTHDLSFLQTLENIIDKRMTGPDQSSYTKQLLQSGEAK